MFAINKIIASNVQYPDLQTSTFLGQHVNLNMTIHFMIRNYQL